MPYIPSSYMNRTSGSRPENGSGRQEETQDQPPEGMKRRHQLMPSLSIKDHRGPDPADVLKLLMPGLEFEPDPHSGQLIRKI